MLGTYKKRTALFLDLFIFSFVCVILLYSIIAPKDEPVVCKGWNIQTIFFIMELIFYSSLEEFLYRIYFLESLSRFLDMINKNKRCSNLLVANFTSHILFATAHIYLGILNVIFAFFMAIFFRFLYVAIKKRWKAFPSFIFIASLHSFYNIFAVFFIKII